MPELQDRIRDLGEQAGVLEDDASLGFEAMSIARDLEGTEDVSKDGFDEEIPDDEPETDREMQLEIRRRIEAAREWREEHLDEDQTDATDRYWGRPLGNEEEGRSKVVSTDLRDTVLAMTPSILRVLVGPEAVVEFTPDSAAAVEMAKQMTKAVQYVVMEDNPGFMVHHAAIKDALVRRLGIIKWWWAEEEHIVGSKHTGVTEEQLRALENDEEVEDYEITGKYQIQGPQGPEEVMDCEIRRRTKRGRVKIAAVPPEEMLFSSDGRSFDEALMLCHLREISVSEALGMGIDPDLVEEHRGVTSRYREGELGSQRRIDETDHDETQQTDEDIILFGEAYTTYDADDDGLAEMLKIRVIGEAFEIIDYELVDEAPFGELCPDPEPHTIIGQSIDDRVADIQKIKSAVLRGSLDSLSLSLNPATEVVEGQVNMRDVMNPEIGAVIRVTRPGMLREVTHTYVGKEAFPMLTYMDEVKEARTGISKASMGLHPDALQSSTQAAVAATLSGAQQALELITRLFAEAGIRKMYSGIAKLLIKHQDYAREIRVGGEFVEMDPRHWRADLNLTVNIALGSGGMQEKITRLMMLDQKQAELMQLGAPFVTWVERRAMCNRLTELAGEADTNAFFAPFGPQEMQAYQQQMAQQPQEDPAITATKEIEAAKIQFEMQKLKVTDDRLRDDAAMDLEAKLATAELQYEGNINRQRVDAHTKAVRTAMDADLKREALQAQAQAQAPQRQQQGPYMLTPDIPDATETLDTISVGLAAERLFQDDAFLEAVRQTEQEFLYEWFEAPTIELREKAHASVRAIDLFLKRLQIVMDRGVVAKTQ